jgi:hypothetical protein
MSFKTDKTLTLAALQESVQETWGRRDMSATSAMKSIRDRRGLLPHLRLFYHLIADTRRRNDHHGGRRPQQPQRTRTTARARATRTRAI